MPSGKKKKRHKKQKVIFSLEDRNKEQTCEAICLASLFFV